MFEIWEELKFFLSVLKSLRVSESMRLGEIGACISTGTYSENWIYYPEKITSEKIVNDAVNFFRSREISFMWPLFDEGDKKILDDAGLIYAGNLTAMSFDAKSFAGKNICEFERVSPEIWALTAWRGFGGSVDDMPKNYCEFVKALDEKFLLMAAKYDGKFAGTFLMTEEEKFSGVYYFATVPEMRRKGIARAMMSEICALSQGKKILLQSTPAGLAFYKSFGFQELGKIPVYSNESDIF